MRWSAMLARDRTRSDNEPTGLTKVPGLHLKDNAVAGRYRVDRLLGAGSSGFVVAARHIYMRRRVTLKILTAGSGSPRAQRRCLAAAQRAAALRGPHVARVVDTGLSDDGMAFIASEHLEGRTVADELAARRQVPAMLAVRWILQACEALAEAHAAGIVHGDLKPQNLFLVGAFEPVRPSEHDVRAVKVLDFGMASRLEEEEDSEGAGAPTWFASPAYLPPEQLRDPGNLDPRVDIWALGVLLHELIAGSLPFTAGSVAGMFVAVAHDEPALLAAADVPYELARVVQACLAKDPAGRPADVAVLARRLAPFAGAEGASLANRVDAALSSVAMTMTIESSPEPVASASAAMKPTLPFGSPEPDAGAEPRSVPAGGPEAALAPPLDGFKQRRIGALAAVLAAALLALVGFLKTPRQEIRPQASADEDDAVIPSEAVRPFVPHTFAASPDDRRPDVPIPTSPNPPPVSRRFDVVATPPGRTLAPVPPRARTPLLVRDDPYGRGFTHPNQLGARK
jgi:serine/threonine protein kinase